MKQEVTMLKVRMHSKIPLLLVFMLLFSCTNYTDKDLIKKYGIDYNSVRKKVGLEPIPNNFLIGFCTRKGDDFQINYLIDSTCFDKNKILIKSKVDKPRFIMKTVFLSKNQIIIEVDNYIHPICFNAIGSDGQNMKVNTRMSFECHFTDHDYYKKGWVYILTNGSTGGISKFQADSILHSWGLTRPR